MTGTKTRLLLYYTRLGDRGNIVGIIPVDSYEKVFHLIPDALIVLGKGGIVEQVNPSAEQLFLRPASEMVRTPLRAFLQLPTEDGQPGRGHRDGGDFAVSVQRRELGGSSTLCIVREISNVPELGSSDQAPPIYALRNPANRGTTATDGHKVQEHRILGTHTDITAMEETVHALQESESRFRALIEDLDVGVVLQDRDDNILLSNAAADRILGIVNPDLEGISSRDPRWQLVNADGSPLRPEEVPSVIAARTGRPVMNAVLGSNNLSTGERRWLQVSATPRLDAAGNIIHTLVTLIDITAAHRTEMALRESEAKERQLNERFALAAESAGIGVWGNRIHEDHLEWDENMYRIFQVDPGKPAVVVGDFQACVHPEDLDRVNNEGLAAAAQGRSYQSEYRIIWPNGELRHIKSYGQMVLNESGETDRVVGVCYDVTAQRKLEEQLRHAQKMEAVGQLAGGVAHDFNNLLTVINGYCEVLLLEDLGGDGTIQAQIEAIHKAGERAAMLTQQLLVFSRKAPLKPEIVDWNLLAEESGQLLRRLIPENIEILFELSPGPLNVLADRTQLEQLLMNLSLNARDAMEKGGKLTIASRECVFDEAHPCTDADCPPGVYACLTFRDSGTGIQPEHMGRLFEPFFTTKTVGKGTGLGLATVYGVVQQCGGAIGVMSAPGAGTCFNVYIPKANPAAVVSSDESDPERQLRGAETILLVEDEHSV